MRTAHGAIRCVAEAIVQRKTRVVDRAAALKTAMVLKPLNVDEGGVVWMHVVGEQAQTRSVPEHQFDPVRPLSPQHINSA